MSRWSLLILAVKWPTFLRVFPLQKQSLWLYLVLGRSRPFSISIFRRLRLFSLTSFQIQLNKFSFVLFEKGKTFFLNLSAETLERVVRCYGDITNKIIALFKSGAQSNVFSRTFCTDNHFSQIGEPSCSRNLFKRVFFPLGKKKSSDKYIYWSQVSPPLWLGGLRWFPFVW